MADTDEGIDPYRVLQVDPTADHEVIQAAYRRSRAASIPTSRPTSRRPADGRHQCRVRPHP